MKFVMPRLSRLAAATAAFGLVAGLGTAAGAADYSQRDGSRYQSPPPVVEHAPAPAQTGVPASQAPGNTCFYINYDPTSPMGQGSGSGLGRARLVCN